jgi:hypothetical protein
MKDDEIDVIIEIRSKGSKCDVGPVAVFSGLGGRSQTGFGHFPLQFGIGRIDYIRNFPRNRLRA